MPTVQLTGTIKQIGPTETVGSSGFKKRSFLLVEKKDQYPSTWMLETHKDFCSTLDNLWPGQTVTCEVEVTGREWKDKAFNTLKAFRITPEVGQKQPEPVGAISEPEDNLPF